MKKQIMREKRHKTKERKRKRENNRRGTRWNGNRGREGRSAREKKTLNEILQETKMMEGEKERSGLKSNKENGTGKK